KRSSPAKARPLSSRNRLAKVPTCPKQRPLKSRQTKTKPKGLTPGSNTCSCEGVLGHLRERGCEPLKSRLTQDRFCCVQHAIEPIQPHAASATPPSHTGGK